MTTMPRGRRAAGATLLLAAMLGVPAHARADRCCFAACRPIFGGPMGLVVSCRTDDCPRSVGGCVVWAHKDAGVRCDGARGCPVGLYAEEAAEALAIRLASDADLVVTHEMAFALRSGAVLVFETRP